MLSTDRADIIADAIKQDNALARAYHDLIVAAERFVNCEGRYSREAIELSAELSKANVSVTRKVVGEAARLSPRQRRDDLTCRQGRQFCEDLVRVPNQQNANWRPDGHVSKQRSVDMTIELSQMRLWLHDWANANNVTFIERGEVGFGRPCVGIVVNDHYVDRWPDDVFDDEPMHDVYKVAAPEDAYHKHDCLAVLVHNENYDSAIEQLFYWVSKLERAGATVTIVERKTSGLIDAMFHGYTSAHISPRKEVTA